MDPDLIYDTDIDDRPTWLGEPVTEDLLMDYDEWWSEFNANICCARPSDFCGCGGYTDRLPDDMSRMLMPEEPDWESIYESRMQSLADYRRDRDEW